MDDIALYLLGRLLESQRENSQLRLELSRSRVQLRVLQGRLDMRTRQLSELVTSIREFARLYRFARAAAGENEEELRRSISRFLSLDRDGDIEAQPTRSSARTTISLSHAEDWIDLEEDAQRPHSNRRGTR
ncbi:hypothetical protein PR003_g804 [Phytophthora rubi]|uniref:Uncharacterized protein n=1 Tax=Phytophthora rubi TaxID=129364 RepID=A0A6A4G5M9_9STRA|nr:hypothetical protein PF003_g4198 [Phytophthora fragariae]KAE9048050.1 hypothetical protein PR002_g700 [Phytophthora rubi]KAE9359358.1 hypothetical protein PR003_g804 [Phytophthora rubi]